MSRGMTTFAVGQGAWDSGVKDSQYKRCLVYFANLTDASKHGMGPGSYDALTCNGWAFILDPYMKPTESRKLLNTVEVEPVQSVKDLDYAKAGIEAVGVTPEELRAKAMRAAHEQFKADAQRISEEKKWATDFIKTKPAPWKCAAATCKTPTAGRAVLRGRSCHQCVVCIDESIAVWMKREAELAPKPKSEAPAYHGPRESTVGGYVWRPGSRYGTWR